MRRRDFIGLFGSAAAAWPLAVRAQQRERIARIGYLSPLFAAEEAGYRVQFQAGLYHLSYLEGQNLVMEYRYAEGDRKRLDELAIELVKLKVDVIATYGLGVESARHATLLVPIVTLVTLSDPVVNHIAARLSHPGGNITGSAVFLPQLMVKRLELLGQVVPSLKRVGVLLQQGNPANASIMLPMEMAAKTLGVELRPVEARSFAEYARSSAEYARAFSAWTNAKVSAVIIADQPQFLVDTGMLAGLAAEHRLASIGSLEFAANTGLMAYGVNYPTLFRRGASFVDKILKGEHPGNIPMEQPTKFRTVVNLRTAKVLGLTVPAMLLAIADEVMD